MLLLLSFAAAARTPAPPPPAPETPVAPPTVDLAEAEPLAPVGDKELKFFAPRHWRLPANARGQTDFTAYTLEWGELRVGLAGVSAGILPRTQLGTVPVLDGLGVANGQLKVDLLRAGPLDLGVGAKAYRFAGETMGAAYVSAGGTASLLITPGWSVHTGAEWSSFAAKGTPNLDPLVPLFDRFVGFAPPEELLSGAEGQLEFDATGEAVVARVATDVRFNRRDSLILQGEAMVWGRADLPFAVPAAITGGAPLQDAEGAVPLGDAYVASLSYQMAMKHLELRVGVGLSSVPGAWVLQSTELAYRFGGKTRNEERRMVRGWRSNKRDLRREARVGTEPATAG